MLELLNTPGDYPLSSDQTCQRHPQEPAAALCQKYGRGLCADCLEGDPLCPDPDIYCTHRPQCLVFFNFKEQRRQRRRSGGPS